MASELNSSSSELEILGVIDRAMGCLSDDDARNRVLTWLISKYGKHGALNIKPSVAAGSADNEQSSTEFNTPEDLYDAANPQTGTEKALVIAYWFQYCMGETDFGSQAVNSKLKDLGHGVANITSSFTDLISQRLVLQVQKTGKSQQARKKYKLTRLGQQRVQEMLGQKKG